MQRYRIVTGSQANGYLLLKAHTLSLPIPLIKSRSLALLSSFWVQSTDPRVCDRHWGEASSNPLRQAAPPEFQRGQGSLSFVRSAYGCRSYRSLCSSSPPCMCMRYA